MKIYTCSPLPFQGQKRGWYNNFTSRITLDFANVNTFVDLFGGSGILSQFVKQVRPDARVIYNDFDNFSERLKNIPDTNERIKELREATAGLHSMQRIYGDMAKKVIEICSRAKDITTIGKSVSFSSNFIKKFEDLKENNLYNNIVTTDYDATDYLSGVETVHDDYRNLIGQYGDDVCYLCDPPYLTTNVNQYAFGYWHLTDYLNVISNLHNSNFIYFTSEKSELVELMQWCGKEYGSSIIDGAEIVSRGTTLSKNAKFVDYMIIKKK